VVAVGVVVERLAQPRMAVLVGLHLLALMFLLLVVVAALERAVIKLRVALVAQEEPELLLPFEVKVVDRGL